MKNMIDYRQPKEKGEKNQERDCFRGLAFKNGYLEYPLRDNSAISVGFWGDYISVKPHRHAYYEFALIKKGSCIHNYKGTSIPLVPGDVFLIPPHCEHSYEIQAEVEIYNCNFIAEGLGEEFNGILEELFEKLEIQSSTKDIQGRWNQQEILHLEPKEMEIVEYHLLQMMDEQDANQIYLEHAKTAHLQLILILFRRLLLQRERNIEKYTDQRKTMVYDAINYMNVHLDEKLDLNELAQRAYISVGYFRTIFKDVTGVRPMEYLNRVRVIRSLGYLENGKYTITEAGQKVGFPDPNYYSRIFKKIMGYSPKYFREMHLNRKLLEAK